MTVKPKKNPEVDEDLIKAYKIVFAKSKDDRMKGMAKRLLESVS